MPNYELIENGELKSLKKDWNFKCVQFCFEPFEPFKHLNY